MKWTRSPRAHKVLVLDEPREHCDQTPKPLQGGSGTAASFVEPAFMKCRLESWCTVGYSFDRLAGRACLLSPFRGTAGGVEGSPGPLTPRLCALAPGPLPWAGC